MRTRQHQERPAKVYASLTPGGERALFAIMAHLGVTASSAVEMSLRRLAASYKLDVAAAAHDAQSGAEDT